MNDLNYVAVRPIAVERSLQNSILFGPREYSCARHIFFPLIRGFLVQVQKGAQKPRQCRGFFVCAQYFSFLRKRIAVNR